MHFWLEKVFLQTDRLLELNKVAITQMKSLLEKQ